MRWTKDGSQFNSWIQCYEAFLKNNIQKGSLQEKFLEMGGLPFVREMEESYDCAGICEVPLFYMIRDIAEGPPTVGCMDAAAKGLAQNYSKTGSIAAITGIILLIGMIAACPLCTGFEEEAVEKKM